MFTLIHFFLYTFKQLILFPSVKRLKNVLSNAEHFHCSFHEQPLFIDQGVMIDRSHRSVLRLLLSTEHEVTNFTLEVIMTDKLLLNKLIGDKLDH